MKGAKMITVDFKTRTARNGNKILIKNGIPMNGYTISDKTSIENLDKIYHDYKYSVPNGVKYQNNYFKALNANEISNTDMIIGANREESKANLELAVLEGIINGSIQKLFTHPNQWFWQSSEDKDFIILREWVEPKGV